MHELEKIYRKRKQQILPIVFGFAAVFVFFRVIFPQWADIQEATTAMNTKGDEVKAKEATYTFLNSIPNEVVDQNFTTVTTALPTQKDIVLIYSELNNAASSVGVKLGGFNVKIGGIYSAAKAPTTSTERTINGIPFINILVNISGSGESLRTFSDKLYESVPVVEIKSVDIGKNDARYDVNFYYKPVVLRPQTVSTKPLEPLSGQDVKLLEQLEGWRLSSTTGF